MSKKFKFIMISAMYENGGNTLQRHLDGHPKLFVYPFESQVGNRKISDYFSSVVPHKYRWPQFQIGQSIDEIYEDIWDEELKIRIKTPKVSKFKDVDINLSDKDRKSIFIKILKGKKINSAQVIEAFYKSTFDAWKNLNRSGKEEFYVGYNPVQIFDADKIISDFPDAKIIHIVRNPYSAYAETKHRPAPLGLQRYIQTWNMAQLFAINYAKMYPKNIFIVKFEDLTGNPRKFFTTLSGNLGIKFNDTMLYPSWNGKKLETLYPWGTIQYPTPEYNIKKIKELTKEEKIRIGKLTAYINEHFGYKNL